MGEVSGLLLAEASLMAGHLGDELIVRGVVSGIRVGEEVVQDRLCGILLCRRCHLKVRRHRTGGSCMDGDGRVGEHTLRASVERSAAMLPSARTVELPAQGHLAPAFAPELFCAEVLRGIDQL